MKYLFKKFMTILAGLTAVAMIVAPQFSFAQNYVVSPTYVPTSTLSTAMANQICASLPDSIAAQTYFCVYSPVASTQSIADSDILITNTSQMGATITWHTSIPTTSMVWYSDDYFNVGNMTLYSNSSDGYTMYHTVRIDGINMSSRHLFRVGGLMQSSSTQILSGEQVL
jgi:hypothetical protein